MAQTVASGRSAWGDLLPLLGLISVPATVVAFGERIPLGLVWMLVSLPLFLLLYGLTLWVPRRQAGWGAVAMMVLSLLVLPWFLPASSYFIFGAVLLRVFPRLGTWAYIGLAAAAGVLFCVAAAAMGLPGRRSLGLPCSSSSWHCA